MRRPTLLLAALLAALAPRAEAAVARTNTFTGSSTSGSTTVSSVTIASGEYATVQCGWRLTSTEAISSVTFNGSTTGVTAISGSQVDTIAGDARQQSYQILGRTGTANVVVNWSTAPNQAGCIVRTYSGVDTGGTPLGTVVTAVNNVAPVTANSSTAASGDLVVDNVVHRCGCSLTVGAGQVGVTQINTGGANVSNHASEETGTGAVTMSWTGGTANWATVVLVVKAGAASGPTDKGRINRLGVGAENLGPTGVEAQRPPWWDAPVEAPRRSAQ